VTPPDAGGATHNAPARDYLGPRTQTGSLGMSGARPPLTQLLSVYDALLDEVMPPSLLVTDRGELVHAFGGASRFVHPRDGHIDWPAVRRALDDVGYDGWLTIEDGGLPLKEFGRRIDLIVAGR